MARRYDFEENEGFGAKLAGLWDGISPRVTVGAVTLAIIILGAVIWTSYPDSDASSDQTVPIVRADAGEFKTLPDDPGGMQIAHRDSTVFGTGDENAEVENLLDDAQGEEPLPKSQLFAGLNTEEVAEEAADSLPDQPAAKDTSDKSAQNVTSIEEAIMDDLAKTEPAAGASATPEAAAPSIDMAQAAQVANQLEPSAGAATTAGAETKTATKEAEKAATVEPAAGAASAGNFYVQVGSVREEAGASAEWKKIQAKHTNLSGLTHRVERADLGAKGVFYRIQAGPVSKDKAASACDQIKKVTPGGCLVVGE